MCVCARMRVPFCSPCRFLSKLRPVFFLRPRDYSKSVPVAPFIINYSGALFREYPGPWQVRGGATWLISCSLQAAV